MVSNSHSDLVNKTNLVHKFILSIFINLYVSGDCVPIIPPCIRDSHPHRITSTKCHKNAVVSPDDRPIVVRNMQRLINILIINLCTKLVLFTRLYRDVQSTKHKTSQWCLLGLINYRGADKSLARPTSQCILYDSEKISFDASLVIYINGTNIPPIMIVNRIYENQNLLSL